MSSKDYPFVDFDLDSDFDLDDDLEDFDAFDDAFFAGVDLGDDSEWDEIEAFLSEHEEEGRGQTAPRRMEKSHAELSAASAVPSPPQEAPVPTLGTMIKTMIATVVVCLLILAVFVIVPRIGKESDSEDDGATTGIHHTEVEQSDNNTLNDDITYYDVLNGSKTEVIGQRGIVSMDKTFLTSQVTEEQFIDYIQTSVKVRGFKWFTIDFGDGTGLVSSGTVVEILEYGTIDNLGRIDQLYGTAYQQGGHYNYVVNPSYNDGEEPNDEANSIESVLLNHNPPYVNFGEITISRSDFTTMVNYLCQDAFIIADIREDVPNTFVMYGDSVDITISCAENDNDKIEWVSILASTENDEEDQSVANSLAAILITLYGEGATDVMNTLLLELGIGGLAVDSNITTIGGLTYSYRTNDSRSSFSLLMY